MALAMPAAWAGQFGDYEPQGFLSDYSTLKPMAGDKDAFAKDACGLTSSPGSEPECCPPPSPPLEPTIRSEKAC